MDDLIMAIAKVAGVGVERHSVLAVVCDWCGQLIGEKDGEGVTGISHGCCPACMEKMMPICPKCGANETVWREVFNEPHQPCTAPNRNELGKEG